MKKIVLMLMAAFFMGGVTMAQQARRSDKMPEPKVRAERMTERMAKEYSLDDAQKGKLLEANLALVEKMGDRPMHRRANIKRGKKACESCTCTQANKQGQMKSEVVKKENKRPPLTDEQRAERKAKMEKKQEEMKAARTAYDANLQKIMTKEQYTAYSKNMQNRKNKMESKGKDATKS